MADPFSKFTGAPAGQSASEGRDRLVKELIAKERAATDAKTARLRTLRLAKEASEPQPVARRSGRKRQKQPSE